MGVNMKRFLVTVVTVTAILLLVMVVGKTDGIMPPIAAGFIAGLGWIIIRKLGE
jgi:hypothetical protein